MSKLLEPRAQEVRDVAAACASHGKADEQFLRQVQGYGLTTAEILYRMPDHPSLLQAFLWQEYDLFPRFPELTKFLDFWQREIEGPLHSVRVAHCGLIKPAELRPVDGMFLLN